MSAETCATSPSERFHSLDALRAFALLLGVVFHAAESFEPGVDAYWAIMDRSTSTALAVFRHACHSFRLEIFFLLAGFFAHLVYHRRGSRKFVRNRAGRILVPLAVGWAILYPLLVCIRLWGASVSGRLGQMGVPAEATHLPLWQLTLGFFLSRGLVQRFDLTHLWFLHQLLVLYGAALLLRALWRGICDPQGSKTAWLDRALATVCASRFNTLLLVVPSIPMLMLMDSWGVDTPKGSLLPHLPTTLLFGFLFAVGWGLHRQPALLENLSRRWIINLVLGCVLVGPTRFGVVWLRAAGVAPESLPGIRWLHSALYALMMWAFVLGFLGLFVRWCRNPSSRWRYVADSSYWIYLVHLPLVVWLQVRFGLSPLHWTIKFTLINAIAFPLLFVSYHYLVRSTFIGAQLNGRKYPLRWT